MASAVAFGDSDLVFYSVPAGFPVPARVLAFVADAVVVVAEVPEA